MSWLSGAVVIIGELIFKHCQHMYMSAKCSHWSLDSCAEEGAFLLEHGFIQLHSVFWIQRVKQQGQKCELKRMASSRGYTMQRHLGSGHFGDVFLANKGGKSFAIKKVVNTERNTAQQEIKILKQVDNGNIIK